MIPVYWLWDKADAFWDWGLFKELLRRSGHDFDHRYGSELEEGDFAIVVVPAANWFDKTQELNEQLAKLKSCLVVLTSDESRLFPVNQLKHPNMRLWLGYGHGDEDADLYLPLGVPSPATYAWETTKKLDYFFAGQVTHPSRISLAKHLRRIPGGEMVETGGFAQGMDKQSYAQKLAQTRIAPAPHGTIHPDSFRLYEALEHQAVPIVQDHPYWSLIGLEWLPMVKDWSGVGKKISTLLTDWKYLAAKYASEWDWYKHELTRKLDWAIWELGKIKPILHDITVLIPTSPIEAHPSTDTIVSTIESVRDRLPDAEIIVMADGVRPEQEDMRDAYEEYKLRLMTLAQINRFRVLIHKDHWHQAAMTDHALQFVETPLLLFMEHDTPLTGEIPFEAISKSLIEDQLDVVRFAFESEILRAHRHLMKRKLIYNGVPYNRTVQWSQRPHLARSDYYRGIISKHFTKEDDSIKRTMIEDVMHSVCQTTPWEENRIAIYRPKGNIKRSEHSDARGSQPKFESTFET